MAQQDPDEALAEWPPVDTVFAHDWEIGAAITHEGQFIALIAIRGHRPDGQGGLMPQEEIRYALRPGQLLALTKDLIETFQTGSVIAARHARESGEGE